MERSSSSLADKLKPIPRDELKDSMDAYNAGVEKRRTEYQHRARLSEQQIRGVKLTD